MKAKLLFFFCVVTFQLYSQISSNDYLSSYKAIWKGEQYFKNGQTMEKEEYVGYLSALPEYNKIIRRGTWSKYLTYAGAGLTGYSIVDLFANNNTQGFVPTYLSGMSLILAGNLLSGKNNREIQNLVDRHNQPLFTPNGNYLSSSSTTFREYFTVNGRKINEKELMQYLSDSELIQDFEGYKKSQNQFWLWTVASTLSTISMLSVSRSNLSLDDQIVAELALSGTFYLSTYYQIKAYGKISRSKHDFISKVNLSQLD